LMTWLEPIFGSSFFTECEIREINLPKLY